MAAGDLSQANFGTAFLFGRTEDATFLDSDGTVQMAAADTPRFDHAADGAARGLLVSAGYELGGGERISIDVAALPEDVLDLTMPTASDVTIFHRFAPDVAEDGDWAEVRRAWYSRNAPAAIDALLSQAGHHLEIGLIRGFRPNVGGFVRYRSQIWTLAGVLLAGSAAITDGAGRPLIIAGARKDL